MLTCFTSKSRKGFSIEIRLGGYWNEVAAYQSNQTPFAGWPWSPLPALTGWLWYTCRKLLYRSVPRWLVWYYAGSNIGDYRSCLLVYFHTWIRRCLPGGAVCLSSGSANLISTIYRIYLPKRILYTEKQYWHIQYLVAQFSCNWFLREILTCWGIGFQAYVWNESSTCARC